MTAPNAAHVHTPERAVRAASGPPPVPAERHADFRAAALETAARLGAGLGGDLALVPTHAPAGGVRALLGGGTPLPVAVRTEEEARFGLPLDDVRVHDNPAAHRLATRHLARALTIGRDIVFNDGHYRPDSSTGRGLLAHELAHAVQQRTATGAGPASPAHEAAADAAALAAVSGGPVHRRAVHAGPPASVGVQAAPCPGRRSRSCCYRSSPPASPRTNGRPRRSSSPRRTGPNSAGSTPGCSSATPHSQAPGAPPRTSRSPPRPWPTRRWPQSSRSSSSSNPWRSTSSRTLPYTHATTR
ncbi:DUF4157 domain-containing protein [Kitasatospora aburaviensis]